jgi:hypothetical protein
MLRSQWLRYSSPLLYGLAAGLLWGFLTAAAATPPEWLVYDRAAGLVYKYLDQSLPVTTAPADYFLAEFNVTLIQVTLTFLALIVPAGWATWQLSRIQPRNSQQPPLWPGSDGYLIGLALGGLILVGLFQQLGLAQWFKGTLFTPARVVSIGLGILLPLYMGVSLFLVWFFRLKTIRAPNWDAHIRTSPGRSGFFGFRLWRSRKGGDTTGH